MVADPANLAALIGSRMCHDLISPIGAINNGLELMVMSGAQQSPEMQLIGESVDNASARIRFFRIAFGAAGDQLVGPPEVSSILRDLYKNSRLDVQWLPDDARPRACVRLVFLALMCIETGMPYGGQINISDKDGAWDITGTGDKVNIDADLWSHLAMQQPVQQLQPAHVQFGLMPVVAAEDGRKVRTKTDATSITISF